MDYPSPMCGEAGLQTTALANLAARAEADGIIPVAGFCVNVQTLNSAAKKTDLAKRYKMRQAQDGQEQACNQLPQMGRDGLIGCHKKTGRKQDRIK
jgi:hypothetical protein